MINRKRFEKLVREKTDEEGFLEAGDLAEIIEEIGEIGKGAMPECVERVYQRAEMILNDLGYHAEEEGYQIEH